MLNNTQKQVVLLLQRSPKDDEGWAKVSPLLWPLLSQIPGELAEREGDTTKGGRIRLTEKGQTVVDYLI